MIPRRAPQVRNPKRRIRDPQACFTLIEVLLATLVLGLFLSVAFSTQAGSIVLETRARLEAKAAGLARCKMSEIELVLATDGFPLTDETDSGRCCEIDQDDRFQCSWNITAIELPTFGQIEESMQERATSQTLVATGDDQTAASFEEQAQAFLSMGALRQILPVVQGFLREAIRKVDVTIVWRYRNVVYDFTVTQYVTNPSGGTLGAILQMDLVQRLMQGGNQAMFELLFGQNAGTSGAEEAPP